MANHLSNETSPYLQQHQENPVNWYPWGESALEKAKKENKPIFLSIGYSACHWCHVMAHESFEDLSTAQLLNENFVSIKVDREERPDLDDIYMQAVVLLTGQGGWPLSVFLTPQLQPFYGGTYFPPQPRHGMPSFTQVLTAILEAWKSQPESILKNAEMLTKAVQGKPTHQGETPNLDAVVTHLYASFDWNTSGWGSAPKFPQPMLIEFLIQRALVGSPQAAEMASHLLKHMALGGMYDLVGGGFHRYSTDAHWLIPHFEKMLYDNAQLALAYLHGFALTENTCFQETVEDTLTFIQREMTSPEGGFFASMDADTPEGEGRYYAWQMDELQKLLTKEELSTLQEMTRVSNEGNFESGLNVLRIYETSQEDQGLPPDLRIILHKLKTARDQRTPPGKDRKIITEWNAMTIRAFAEAGLLLNRADYLQIAKKAAVFLLENLTTADGRLHRSWRDGKASQPGTLADYTALIAALHSVYVIDFEPQIYRHMRSLLTILDEDFVSEDSLYEDASSRVADLFVRPRNLQDNATPSGNAMGAYIHWLFANYEHDPSHLKKADQMVKQVGSALENYPTSFGYWLQVAERITNTTQQIALVSKDDLTALAPFLAIYRQTYRPNSIIAAKYQLSHPDDCYPGILEDRPAIHHKPTAYVCEGFTCLKPATKPEEFKQQLNET